MEIIDKKFLTMGETMAYLGCSRGFVYAQIELKKLTTYKVGRRTYIKREQLEHLIETDKKAWQ